MTGGTDEVSSLPDNILVLAIVLVEITDSLSVTILVETDISSILVAGLVDVTAKAIELLDKVLIEDDIEVKLLLDIALLNGTENFSLLKFAVEETDGILTSLLLDAIPVTVVGAAEVNIGVMRGTDVLAVMEVVASPSELYEPITDSVDVSIEVSKVAVVYKLDVIFTVELMIMSVGSNSVVESTGTVDTMNTSGTAVVDMTEDRAGLVF